MRFATFFYGAAVVVLTRKDVNSDRRGINSRRDLTEIVFRYVVPKVP